jgi:5-methylcytosine-specific restriction endonuclease McrA
MPCCPGYRIPGAKYCAKHAPQFAEQDQDRRGTATERGYGSRWARYRLQFLREHSVCACGCGHAATDVDHIKPVSGPDDPLFWESGNHQALAHECHSRKTVLENGGFGRTKK